MGKDVGVRLRTVRKLRGMTQTELSKHSGVSQAAISDLEKGESRTPTGTNLVALARCLEVNPDWLAEGKGDMERIDEPLPPEAVLMAREWLKLTPEARADVAKLIRTMAASMPDDPPANGDGKDGKTRKKPRAGSRNPQPRQH